jgi:hypothetical protein
MGYGQSHGWWNIPVVMAGMRSAFPNGQGRHLVAGRKSMGDLFAQVLRMYGGTDTTFGATGTLGSMGGAQGTGNGAPGFINGNTNVHQGPLAL